MATDPGLGGRRRVDTASHGQQPLPAAAGGSDVPGQCLDVSGAQWVM